MIYLLDTSIVSRLMRRDEIVGRRLEGIGKQNTLSISAITRGEILYGIERLPEGKRRDALSAEAERQFAALVCEHITERSAAHYAVLKRNTEQAGTPLDENDLWIAATALSTGATLVVADSDFERLAGVPVENWLS